MLVKMIRTENGVDDGKIHPTRYEMGKVYDIGPMLFKAFSGMGIIQEQKELKPVYEKKVIEPKAEKKTKKKGKTT